MIQDDKTEAQSRLAATCEAADVWSGHVYRHYKGGEYVVFAVTIDEASLESLVHYYSLEKRTRWTRTIANFTQAMDNPLYRFVRVRVATFRELTAALWINLTVDSQIYVNDPPGSKTFTALKYDGETP